MGFALDTMFSLLTSPDKLCFKNGSIEATVAAATILSNVVSCLEPNMISPKYACHPPGIQQLLHETLATHPSEYKGHDGAYLARRRTKTFSAPQTTATALFAERSYANKTPRLLSRSMACSDSLCCFRRI
jgi:hypothetical protein